MLPAKSTSPILFSLTFACLAHLCASLSRRSITAAQSGRLTLSQQLPVWIHGYARSGSSTILSMVTEAVGTQTAEADEHEATLLHEGEDCYISCGSKGGHCDWCGSGACCRDGWGSDPAECSLVTQFKTGVHECVAPPRKHDVFSLFEPCHGGDVLDPELAAQGCQGLVLSLAQCKFDQIRSLHGWRDKHSKTGGVLDYSPGAANEACGSSKLIAFKTISQAAETFHVGSDAVPVLEREPRLRLIDIVRDPRDIYSSWMSTFPFNDTRLGGVTRDVNALTGLCDSFAAGLLSHDKIHRVVFEDLVREPARVMKEVYSFLELPYGERQDAWVRKTFNAKDCPGVDMYIAPYSDCHTNATSSLEKWRDILLESERVAFRDHTSCQAVARAYKYNVY